MLPQWPRPRDPAGPRFPAREFAGVCLEGGLIPLHLIESEGDHRRVLSRVLTNDSSPLPLPRCQSRRIPSARRIHIAAITFTALCAEKQPSTSTSTP